MQLWTELVTVAVICSIPETFYKHHLMQHLGEVGEQLIQGKAVGRCASIKR